MQLFVCSALVILFTFSSCSNSTEVEPALEPIVVTDTVFGDTDDPAIWINQSNLDSSLVLGTDKHKENGGVYVFNLNGRIDKSRSRLQLKRVNNVDVAYGLKYNNTIIDIAVATERDEQAIRVFALPSMQIIDGGGIKVFQDDSLNLPMGIALYKRERDGNIFAVVGRKEGPLSGYLYQYLLYDSSNVVKAKLVRKFGSYSGKKEIESIAVDNPLGYVYYSDEQIGIRKYHADPDSPDVELAIFGTKEFKEDNEGISIYSTSDKEGYILVSDQSANRFNVYARQGSATNPHEHKLIKRIPFSTNNSDGSDVTSVELPGFKGGIFVAMSDNKTFQFYSWQQIIKQIGKK
jgi:3-phytase